MHTLNSGATTKNKIRESSLTNKTIVEIKYNHRKYSTNKKTQKEDKRNKQASQEMLKRLLEAETEGQ